MARDSSGAIDRQVSLSKRFSSGIGSVLVTTISVTGAVLEPVDGGSGQDRVGRGDDHAGGAVAVRASAACTIVPPVSIMSSTRTQMRPRTSPTTRLATVSLGRSVRRVLWMNASGAPSEPGRPALGDLDPAGVGADHGELLVAVLLLDVVGQDRQRHQVVDRAVEEALDLVGVQVDGDQPVGAGGLEQVGHQPRRDRLAAAVLLVLAGVAVERHHDGDPLGAGAA